jgi:MscS family membrane protein
VVQLIGWLAVVWLMWRWADAAGEVILGQMSRRGQLSAYSAVSFLNRAFKALLIVLLIASLLGAFGVNVTAGLAALGVGGLAIALGAQKLFENLIGSLTLIADRPMRIGDFGKFGDTLGTVEEIGIRSTRIRTLDRTVLTVPNGQLSAQTIENYTQRDRYWFHPILNLRYETSPDQMRHVLQALRTMLAEHSKVDATTARVRLISLGAHSLDIEIFAYVIAWDYAGFLEVQEDLILRCMDIVAASGTGFAFPSQTLYLGRDDGLDEERTRAAEEIIRRQRDQTK